MNARRRMTLLAATLASAGLLATACGERSAEKIGATVDRTTSQMAAVTDRAADQATTVVADATITGKVKAAIFAEPGLKSLQIDVDTRNNVVTLNGTVGSMLDKARAIQVAQTVPGVASVVDNLAVKSTG